MKIEVIRIEKENTIIIILIIVLVLGIFVSSNPDFINDITGKFVGVSGKATDCPKISVDRVQALRGEIEGRMDIIRTSFGVSIWSNFKEFSDQEKIEGVSNTIYLYELRDSLNKLMVYYWNLERVSDAPNKIYGIDIPRGDYSGSDTPLPYVATQKELFQQAFEKDGWSNAAPTCLNDGDLNELEQAVSKLKWLFIILPNMVREDLVKIYPNSVFSYGSVDWTEGRGGAYSLDPNLDESWRKSTERFENTVSRNTNIDNCWVYMEGVGLWERAVGEYATTKQTNKCFVTFNLLKLPEIAEAKAYFFMSYGVGGAQVSDLVGAVKISDIASSVYRGYNLIDIKISNEINKFEISPDIIDVKPNVATKDGVRYGKGFEGGLWGIFVSAFSACKIDEDCNNNLANGACSLYVCCDGKCVSGGEAEETGCPDSCDDNDGDGYVSMNCPKCGETSGGITGASIHSIMGMATTGYSGSQCRKTKGDCDDNDRNTNPNTKEICDDNKDNDCDGNKDCADEDCLMKSCEFKSKGVSYQGICSHSQRKCIEKGVCIGKGMVQKSPQANACKSAKDSAKEDCDSKTTYTINSVAVLSTKLNQVGSEWKCEYILTGYYA